jgi:hypothetical protein
MGVGVVKLQGGWYGLREGKLTKFKMIPNAAYDADNPSMNRNHYLRKEVLSGLSPPTLQTRRSL